MDDQKRVKLLAAGLGVVVAIFSLRSTIDRIVMKPLRDLESKVSSAASENEKLTDEQLRLQIAERNLDNWKSICLPQNPNDAQRLYREWIAELARQSGFSGSGFEIVPGAKSLQKEFRTVALEIKKAETDLQGLTRFLYLFDQTDLLHRISMLKIESTGAQGNPRLVVTMTVEGMSVEGAEDKSELLPRTTLKDSLPESSGQLVVEPSEIFPTWDPFEPFLIRIERELLRVEEVTETGWKVTRGVNGTRAGKHDPGSIVELLPVSWDRKERTLEQYADFIKDSMFVIPSPPRTWTPRLGGIADKTIKPGDEVRFTARAENFNPELGIPQFSLQNAAEGMLIDTKTGEFTWKQTAAVPPGKYTATVLVTQADNPDLKLQAPLTVTVRSLNQPPVLSLPPAATVVIGREFKTKVSATDDGPVSSLKYSLGSGTPEGLKIDASSGEITWTPARTFTPGKYDVEIRVSDSGDDPKTTSGKIAFDVQDDNAALTLLTGSVAKDGVQFAWFRNKGTGKTDQLRVGETLSVSEIHAEILEVTNRFIKLRDSEGVWRLALGDTLRDRKLLEPAAPSTQPVPESAPATSAVKSDTDSETMSETDADSDTDAETDQKEPSPPDSPDLKVPVENPGDPPAQSVPEPTVPESAGTSDTAIRELNFKLTAFSHMTDN